MQIPITLINSPHVHGYDSNNTEYNLHRGTRYCVPHRRLHDDDNNDFDEHDDDDDCVVSECGKNEDLRSRFKKRDTSKNVARYIPQRLKVSANDEGSQMSGYLKKRQKNSKWKRCWFVLKDRVLYTYKASEDAVATDTLPVLGLELEPLSDVRYFYLVFIIFSNSNVLH